MQNPLVSVIVTTYNHQEYITDCLDGILMQQTNFLFEIILGEDESTDGTRNICIEYANKYPGKIKLYLRSRKDVIYINGNPTGRYNFTESLKSCKGKYIALCEGDDYWTDPLKLQKQVDFLEGNSDYVISCTNANAIDENNNIIIESVLDSESKSINIKGFLKLNNPVITPTVLFKNNLLKDINFIVNYTSGDWPLWAYLLHISQKKIYYLDSVTTSYRIHEGGIFSNLNLPQRLTNKKNNFLNFKKEFNSYHQEINAVIIKIHHLIINNYFAEKKKSKAVFYFLKNFNTGYKLKRLISLLIK